MVTNYKHVKATAHLCKDEMLMQVYIQQQCTTLAPQDNGSHVKLADTFLLQVTAQECDDMHEML